MVGLSSHWLAAGLVFLAVALGALALALMVEWAQERRRRRLLLQQLQSYEDASRAEGETGGLFRGATVAAGASWVRVLARGLPALSGVPVMIEQAGLKGTLESFLLQSVAVALTLGALAYAATGFLLVGMVATVGGALTPYIILRLRRSRRLRSFEAALPEAIDLLVRAVRAGHPLSAGLQMVADETRPPVAGEFRRAFEEQRFGLPFDDALMALTQRVPLMDMRMLVTAILIQRTVGGNLAEVLENLATVIRARFVVRRQLRTYTAQGRVSGYVLAVLPLAVGSILYLMNREYVGLLFETPAGRTMLTVACMMQVAGYLWIRKIVNIDI